MKLPRDLSGSDLVRALSKLGYAPTRQSGSHMRLTRPGPPEHHITVPAHDPLKVGTLASIVRELAEHHHLSRDEVLRRLF
ncbi:MAG: type II toxin-antitoxin system HicA family toxin [Phycisphaerales bacterium]